MSIDARKVFIKCPECGYENVGYDYHENTSSERSEIFNVLNASSYVCSGCKAKLDCSFLFERGYCSVEDVSYYKRLLTQKLERFAEGGYISFSDWDYGKPVTERPALTRLCAIYPEDGELKHLSMVYTSCRSIGPRYLSKLETGQTEITRDQVVMPTCLRKVYMHDGVEVIGENAFRGCTALHDVFLPDSVTRIRSGAFAESGLRTVRTSDAITELGDRAFFGCSALTGFFFPSTLKAIGASCFEGCTALTELSVPDGVSVGKNAFLGCTALERIELPASLSRHVEALGLPDSVRIEWRGDVTAFLPSCGSEPMQTSTAESTVIGDPSDDSSESPAPTAPRGLLGRLFKRKKK